jgi:hypothetical protein
MAGVELRASNNIWERKSMNAGSMEAVTINEEWSDNPFAHHRASQGSIQDLEEGGPSNGSALDSWASKDLFQIILLFTGVAKPATWHSAWWLCWVGWRLMLILQLIYTCFLIFWNPISSDYFFVGISSFIAYGPSALNWCWLPGLWAEVVVLGAQTMTANEAKTPTRLSLLFIGFWLMYTIVASSVLAPRVGGLFGVLATAILSSNIAPLGSFLLVLSVDVTLSQIKVKKLVAAARDKKLTRQMYMECTDHVRERSSRWAKPLGLVAITAVYSAVALLIRIGEVSTDTTVDPALQLLREFNDVDIFGKEATLLFLVIFAVFGLNDDADSIISELVAEPWGEYGSPDEGGRLDLLHLATTYAVRAEGLSSATAFFTARTTRPISFRMCGARVTRAYFVAAVASFSIALVNVLARVLYKPAV